MKEILLYAALILFVACSSPASEEEEEEAHIVSPVRVAQPMNENMSDIIELNAVSKVLKKDVLRAPIAGYLESIKAEIGSVVQKGAMLFTIRTKESNAIGRNKVIDSLVSFSGVIPVRSPLTARVDSIMHQQGDFVQEGDELLTLAEQDGIVFILNVPYEYIQFIRPRATCEITLSGGNIIKGLIGNPVSSDAVSQTAGYIVKPIEYEEYIPEFLNAKVRIVKNEKAAVQTVPKEAVLADETQQHFWIMKMINDSTAVKVPIKKGIENNDNIEILMPKLNATDKVLIEGHYGLPDTATVSIEK